MIYQMKIVVRKEKVDEFLATLSELSCDLKKKKGCLSYDVYKGVEQENVFCIIGELTSAKASQEHLRNRNFEVLLGAARTLSEDFKLIISNNVEMGSFELAKSKITTS